MLGVIVVAWWVCVVCWVFVVWVGGFCFGFLFGLGVLDVLVFVGCALLDLGCFVCSLLYLLVWNVWLVIMWLYFMLMVLGFCCGGLGFEF